MYRAFLGLALAVVMSTSASAASVGFMGSFEVESAGVGTGFLGGALPVAFSAFEDEFEFSEGAAFGTLTKTADFTIGATQVFATSGSVNVTDNGINDSVSFVLNISTTGPVGSDGILLMTFTGDLISGGSVVNQANFAELMGYPVRPPANSPSTGITYIDDSTATQHVYQGTAFAVPEPSSILCLASLGCVAILRRRRA